MTLTTTVARIIAKIRHRVRPLSVALEPAPSMEEMHAIREPYVRWRKYRGTKWQTRCVLTFLAYEGSDDENLQQVATYAADYLVSPETEEGGWAELLEEALAEVEKADQIEEELEEAACMYPGREIPDHVHQAILDRYQ